MESGGKRFEEVGSSSASDLDERKSVAVEENGDQGSEVEQEIELEEEDHGDSLKFVPAPLVPLKEHLEKDKDDESLRRWKEKLLGSVEGDLTGQMEPEVTFQSIGIVCGDLGEMMSTPLPVNEKHGPLFTLKEGCVYRLKLTFMVKHNIVSGLVYTNTVWKAGIRVDQSKGMLGTFAPQRDPYVHLLEEETTPSGLLARGTYSAKLKFEDDDKKCHMELKYSFEIKKS